MRLTLMLNVMLGISALLITSHANADLSYLPEMPKAETVVSDMRINGERNNASRVSATLEILATMLENLTDGRASQGQLTSEEATRLAGYRKTSERIKTAEKMRSPLCLGNSCDSRMFARCQNEYLMSAELRREILDRYFSRAWQQRYLPKLKGTLWRNAVDLPVKQVRADFRSSPNCSDGGERAAATTMKQRGSGHPSKFECAQQCEAEIDCRDMFGNTTILGRSTGGRLPNAEKFQCDLLVRQCVDGCVQEPN